ncbi:hypothetical protein KM043_014963 [Ampulex compressa]|nr:hypothetical protein KM043_014963 [Ampulex compressa]
MASFLKNCSFQLFSKCLKQSVDILAVPRRGKKMNPPPKKRLPPWLPRPERVLHDEALTTENKEFIQEVIESKFGPSGESYGMNTSPLKDNPIEPITEWQKEFKRTGLIAKKIGVYPMWLKNGKKVTSTLLQILDNQVIQYVPPEKYNAFIHPVRVRNKLGCLLVGAENVDPQQVTKNYYGVFKKAGLIPKRILMRFFVSPQAALQPGTPLYAAHFKPGDVVDIRAKTVDRGFQGVMKRWGFKGMPASHGVTKTHRRPGNIGSGGALARVMPGTKLPGHMGNRWRTHRGIKILRVNTKYNVIWILGHNLPGETNTYCYVYDTLLPHKKPTSAPYFPTFMPGVSEESIAEELYADDVHPFSDPTIISSEES